MDICAPGWIHAEIAIAALAAGKHVLVEKPLANTLAEAEAMTRRPGGAQTCGVQSMVGFNYRRVPALALARELIAEGRLGDRPARPRRVPAGLARRRRIPHDLAAPQGNRGSGALGDIASHAIDQVQHLLGDAVTDVSGRLHTFTADRPGPHGTGGCHGRRRRLGHADARLRGHRLGGGLPRGHRPEERPKARDLRRQGFAILFDLENLNELGFLDATVPVREQGFRRILVNEPEHPYLQAWWPQGQ